MAEATKQQVLDLLRAPSPEGLVRFVEGLPPASLTDTAMGLLNSRHPGMVIVALSPIAQEYGYGSYPELGAAIAGALHERAWELWQSSVDHGLIETTLSGLAATEVKALSLLGRTDEIVALTDVYIPRYEALPERENLPAFYVLRLEALVMAERFDEAAQQLEEAKEAFEWIHRNPIWSMELARLERRIAAARGSAVSMPGEASGLDPGLTAEQMMQGLLAALGPMGDALTSQVGELSGAGRSLDPTNPEDFSRINRMLSEGEAFLTKGVSGPTELTVRGKIRAASAIFVHSTPTRERILESQGELEEARAWSVEQGIHELENDANWGLYLCHSRLGDPSGAADDLIRLRSGLERRRAGLRDPLQRAGIFADYPYLFRALVEKLHSAGRVEDLLEAIEASKGRAIADRLTEDGREAVADSAIYASVRRLPELTGAERFHYLTYFVDDERVYAVLVDTSGELHTPDPIDLPQPVIAEAASAVDPEKWDQKRADPADRFPTSNVVLAPLVAWLETLLRSGAVSRGDHLVYSPDLELHNVPLQYLRFGDGILLDELSVSRVQTAFDIVRILEGDPVRGERFVGFVVPSKAELERNDHGRMIADMRAPIEWLADRMTGSVAPMEADTVGRVVDEDLDGSIVHFSTHGVFPLHDDPFEGSYLLMADEEGLPATATFTREPGRLTPAKVLHEVGKARGSHISMMACVSGRAAEGLGGDALGLDWSFLQAGASSLLSAHWEVSAGAAAAFFTRFYEKWLKDDKPRGAALREATLELLDGRIDQASLARWTPFSLTGDFR